MAGALIFDFDGVIADSEVLANTVLAELVTELGVPPTIEDAYRDDMGKRFHEVIAAIEQTIGRALPQSSRHAPLERNDDADPEDHHGGGC